MYKRQDDKRQDCTNALDYKCKEIGFYLDLFDFYSFPPEVTRGLMTPGISGSLTPPTLTSVLPNTLTSTLSVTPSTPGTHHICVDVKEGYVLC